MGGAKSERCLQPAGHPVYGDNSPRRSMACCLNAVQADATCADHDNIGMLAHICAVCDGAKAGDNTAGQDGSHVESQVGIDFDDLRSMYRRPFGKSCGFQTLTDWLTALIDDLDDIAVVEQVLATAAKTKFAAGAGSTGADHGQDDMISWRHVIDGFAHSLDDAGTFMPIYCGEIASPRAGGKQDVGVTDRRGSQANQDVL